MPKDFSPYLYELTINTLNFDPRTEPVLYKANVTVFFTCVRDTRVLVLNAKDIGLEAITLRSAGQELDFKVTDTRQENELLTIDLTQAASDEFFKKGENYTFSALFHVLVKADNSGIFKRSYQTDDGTRWLLASQLEAAEARKAFICFDEPEFKARFALTVIHNENLGVISNTPVKYR